MSRSSFQSALLAAALMLPIMATQSATAQIEPPGDHETGSQHLREESAKERSASETATEQADKSEQLKLQTLAALDKAQRGVDESPQQSFNALDEADQAVQKMGQAVRPEDQYLVEQALQSLEQARLSAKKYKSEDAEKSVQEAKEAVQQMTLMQSGQATGPQEGSK